MAITDFFAGVAAADHTATLAWIYVRITLGQP